MRGHGAEDAAPVPTATITARGLESSRAVNANARATFGPAFSTFAPRARIRVD
jgi:hypothetical protein